VLSVLILILFSANAVRNAARESGGCSDFMIFHKARMISSKHSGEENSDCGGLGMADENNLTVGDSGKITAGTKPTLIFARDIPWLSSSFSPSPDILEDDDDWD
jgi:hypothetical protein